MGFSIDEARDAEGKRRGQKREGRFFDMLPDSKKTFADLAEWFIDTAKIKNLASRGNVVRHLVIFNETFDRKQITPSPATSSCPSSLRSARTAGPIAISIRLATPPGGW